MPWWELAQSAERLSKMLASQGRTNSVDPFSDWVSARHNQCLTTGISKAVVCAILSVEKVYMKTKY